MAAILGLNAVFHDSAAALVVDGRLVALAEEERYTRVRGGKRAAIENTALLPFRAIEEALRAGGLRFKDLECVAYGFDPQARFAALGAVPADPGIKDDAYGGAAGERRLRGLVLSTEGLLAERFGTRVPVVFVAHHRAHLASAYYSGPWDEAALLTVDGIGEGDTCTWALGKNGRIEPRGSLSYPNSLGFLWEHVTEWAGLTPNQDEGSLMALAAYGDPARFRAPLRRLLQTNPDGLFTVDPARARFRSGDLSGIVEALGPRRDPAAAFEHEGRDRAFADAAAALQELTEEALLSLVRRVKRDTGCARLALAGGVALNCRANGALAASGVLEGLWVVPPAKDCGTALGAAWAAWLERHGPPARSEWTHAYFGVPDAPGAVDAALKERGLTAPPEPRLVARAADLLAEGKVVAWYEGAMEVGPRALGHRSLLADPRDGAMRERLNGRIKHRRAFRPFGPVLREEDAGRFFSIPPAALDPCRFMLAAVPARPEARALIPAAVHHDGSSRPQLLSRASHPRLHDLLGAFGERTGVPVLLNTSFNVREPIVGTPRDALKTYFDAPIDALVLEDRLLVK